MFTRTFWCEDCAKKGRPHVGDYYAVFGHDRNSIVREHLEHNVHVSVLGFTPHLVEILRVNLNGTVDLEVTCGMQKCGVLFFYEKEKLKVMTLKFRLITMTPEDFKKLYEYKDLGYRL